MATIEVRDETLAVVLTPWEVLGSIRWRTPVTAVRSAVASIVAVDDAWAHLRGIRAPGTGFPGVIMLGTTRGSGYKDFCAVYGHRPGVVVTFMPGSSEFARWVLSDSGARGGVPSGLS